MTGWHPWAEALRNDAALDLCDGPMLRRPRRKAERVEVELELATGRPVVAEVEVEPGNECGLLGAWEEGPGWRRAVALSDDDETRAFRLATPEE